MAIFFNVLIHLLIIVGIFAMIYYTARIIIDKFKQNQQEGLILVATVVFALFAYFTSIAFSISIPSLLFQSFEISDIFSLRLFLGNLLMGGVGIALSWYITSKLKSSTVIGLRIVVLLLILMIILFGDVYVHAMEIRTYNHFNRALLPNVCFVLGILGYIIFNYKNP